MTLIVASNAALFTYHVKHQSKGEQAQEKQIQNDQAQQNQDQKFTTPKPRCQMLPMFPTWCNQERPMNRFRHRHRHQPKMDVPQGSTESSRDQALQELQRFFPSVVMKNQENKTQNLDQVPAYQALGDPAMKELLTNVLKVAMKNVLTTPKPKSPRHGEIFGRVMRFTNHANAM